MKILSNFRCCGIAVLFLIMAALQFSCIKEDTSNCPAYTVITHHYTLNSNARNLIDEEIDSLKILLFDSLNTLSHYEEVVNPTAGNKTYISLPQGNYTAVTIGGNHSSYRVFDNATGEIPKIGATQMSDLKVRIIQDETTRSAQRPTNLFMSTPTPFVAKQLKETTVNVPLTKMVKHITLRVIGAPTHTAQIDIDHSLLNFDATADTTAMSALYNEVGAVDGDTTEYDYKVLRLFADDETARLNLDFNSALSPQQNGYYPIRGDNASIDLMKTITDNPDYATQEGLDRESNFDVEVAYKDDIGIVISINGWVVKTVYPY